VLTLTEQLWTLATAVQRMREAQRMDLLGGRSGPRTAVRAAEREVDVLLASLTLPTPPALTTSEEPQT
jgi:hypothetical protein